ncbi:hypothetical protein AN911_01715 [Mycobacteroides immunogenum]|nr:hypothetical protein AN911_01715 [Mycobacteroides immunogenum]
MCGVLSAGFLIMALLAAPIESGSKAEWLSGIGTLTAVVVALWQTTSIQKQAKEQSHAALERLERELKAAEDRSNAKLETATRLHQSELESQRELARIQRLHLQEQEFKLALIRVSRTIDAYCRELTAMPYLDVQAIPKTYSDQVDARRAAREALKSLARDVHLEITGAQMLSQNDSLRESLDIVKQAMSLARTVAERYRTNATSKTIPDPLPIWNARNAIQTAIRDTIKMASESLHAGWEQ